MGLMFRKARSANKRKSAQPAACGTTPYWEVTREVKMRFDREGISIPFPQRDVHFYEERRLSGSTERAPARDEGEAAAES